MKSNTKKTEDSKKTSKRKTSTNNQTSETPETKKRYPNLEKARAVKKTKKKEPKPPKLTEQQKAFCREYVKSGNGQQSAIKAGYSKQSARHQASQLLTRQHIKDEIARINSKRDMKAIMDANEVMELFTQIARGEVKDQFGLDASLNDRIKAAQELAKRTVDIENRINGKADSLVEIKLNWKRE